MTYHLTTFGCQMNKSDSERIMTVLENMNFKPASSAKADILIFNLCSVRQSAIDRVWGILAKYKKPASPAGRQLTKQKKNSFIILTGCILPADRKKFKNKVDLILNIVDLPHWPEKLKIQTSKLNQNSKFKIQNFPKSPPNYFSINPNHSSQFKAYVPIMTGCNNFCAYCAVPYTRGREQSRPVEDIIQEVYTLIIQGYKEIILLGQNVNSYNTKMSNPRLIKKSQITSYGLQVTKNKKINFSHLLKLIDSIPGSYWLSFLTSHPKDMSDGLIKCFTKCQHLIPYLHLPLQSGSDKILKAMNRKYTAADYLKLIRKIRLAKRDINISTDVIVGFPGETKKDFAATAKIMQDIKFDMAYIAEYSPRPNTQAALMQDDVPKKEKERRTKILNDILKKTAQENNQKIVSKTVDVLVESVKDNLAFGHTKMMKNVRINLDTKNTESTRPPCFAKRSGQIKTQKTLIGQFAKVTITKAGAWGLEGIIVAT